MSTQMLGYYVLAIVVGILGGIHVPINGALGARINSPLVATFSFYGIGFLLITLICAVTYDRAAFSALATAPRWYFVAGMISVVVVGSNTFLIPRVGALRVFVIVLSMQLIARMVISHFGWLASPVSSISPIKLVGCLLLIAGAVLVVRY
ncbi:MAG TPA: DMT family transporter [bacterium]|nr:DMT family transporter [bacterium]